MTSFQQIFQSFLVIHKNSRGAATLSIMTHLHEDILYNTEHKVLQCSTQYTVINSVFISQCCYTECHYAECDSAEGYYAKWNPAECLYEE